ncbi:MAG: lamin tail domain-containing protein [Flavobacteriales bacterium]|nr:lamin tail domain-containing protein [Flavobacteriales bacterium]
MKQRYTHPALLFSTLLVCAPCVAQVVINEVDYDQVGTDNAEFLEIKNIGDALFPLANLRVVLINGNNGGAAEYRTIESSSWPAIAPGAYFVICANQGLTLNCDHVATPATNLIQNGSPDAIALVSVLDGTIFDALSYGGSVPGYTEGTGTTAEDSNAQDGLSLCRWPDGSDTNDNDADFVIGCPTPGAANQLDPTNCSITTNVQNIRSEDILALLPDANARRIGFIYKRDAAAPVNVSVFTVQGALVASRDLGVVSSAYVDIPVAQEAQLYLVRIQVGDERITRRVVMP